MTGLYTVALQDTAVVEPPDLYEPDVQRAETFV